MTGFNPLETTERIQEDYTNFFLTSFSPNNWEFMEKLKEISRKKGHLWKGPYISIPPRPKFGGDFKEFEKGRISDEIKRAFSYIKKLYRHQEKAIRHILDGNNTIIAVPTGSGKTEIFMIPILQYCYENRTRRGTKAILIYPMNALARDQVERLRRILWTLNKDLPEEEKITFAIYTGDTPKDKDDLRVKFQEQESSEICPLPPEDMRKFGCSRDCTKDHLKYDADREVLYCERKRDVIIDYQILTRKSIREKVPDILITNYVQLEHILSKKDDESWLSTGSLRFVVLDEIHSYSGSKGVDVAFLMRRLRKEARSDPIFIGTSATLSQKQDEYERKRSIAEFAQQIFGSEFSIDDVIEAEYEEYVFPAATYFPEKLESFDKLLESIENLDDASQNVILEILSKINPHFKLYGDKEISVEISKALLQNAFFQELVETLNVPKSLDEIIKELKENSNTKGLVLSMNHHELADVIWSYLKLGSKCKDPFNPSRPLINVTVHLFFKTIERIYQCNECGTLYMFPRDKCEYDGSSVDEIGVCRFCGHTFNIIYVDKNEFKEWYEEIKKLEKVKNSSIMKIYPREKKYLRKLDYRSEFSKDAVAIWISDDLPTEEEKYIKIKRCRKCGAILDSSENVCLICGSEDVYEAYAFVRYNEENIADTRPISCPYCGNRYGRYSALSPIVMSSDTASVVVFDRLYSRLPEEYKKLLIFTDNRQIASYLAKHLEDTHFDHTIRILVYHIVRNHGKIYLQKLLNEAYKYVMDWPYEKIKRYGFFETTVLEEICSLKGKQRSLENLGLVKVTYDGLDDPIEFQKEWNEFIRTYIEDPSEATTLLRLNDVELWRDLLIALVDYIRQKGAIEGLHNNPLGREEVVGFLLDRKIKKRHLEIFKLLSTGRTKQRVLFQKVFQSKLKSNILDMALKIAFEFLEKNKIIKQVELKCCGTNPDKARGYVINRNRVLLKIPENIFKCFKCQRVYPVSPNGVCLTYGCNGKTEKIPYKEFEEYMKKHNYYFRLYQEEIPVKMITFEDTGAIPSDERHRLELEFKKNEIDYRKVDVIVATPTLELGVDIGDLISVGIYKAPPSPANYVQRVGRAGRKEKMSLNVTFLYLSPLDRYYYEKPEELIRGTFEAPKIDIENRYLLQKHVNAVILYTLMKKKDLKIPRMFNEFANSNTTQIIKQEISKNKSSFLNLIKETFKIESLKMSEIEIMINKFLEDLEETVERFKRELKWYYLYEQKMVQKRKYSKAEKIRQILEKLENSRTVSYLMDVNVLPRYAFPGTYVEVKDLYGIEEFEGRSRNIAITELAPLMRTFVKKKIYKSVGIDMEVLKPKEKVFYVCPNCDMYITDDKETLLNEGCPVCHYRPSEQELETKSSIESAIELNIIYLRKEKDTIFQLREYQEAHSKIYLSKVSGQPDSRPSKVDPNIRLTKYPNPEIVKIVDKIIIDNEERDIELCEKCGKVKEKLKEERRHNKLGTYEKCDGKFRKFVLYHRMPTNVVSIKFESDVIFGQRVENIEEFLVTFKNAILNAAQRILYAQDGEIEGDINPEKREILIYDNVDGGAGYADRIYEKFEEILEEAHNLVTTCECEKGCPNCLWSYWRKRDIPKIDKTLIIPVLDKIVKTPKKDLIDEKKLKEAIKKEFHCENVRTTITNKIDGPMKIKQVLLGTKDEVYVTSLYVTDDKISWPDGEYKSWVDILSLLALKGIKVHLIVRSPSSEKHKRALERLKANGVKVYVYEKPIEDSAFRGIVHAKIIVCDPFKDNRKVIFTSANLSAEVTKNVDFYLISEEEECTRRTLQKIRELINESKKY